MNETSRPRVSFDDIEDAMSMVREHVAHCYLHRSTGEVVVLVHDAPDEELAERVEADYESYVSIPAEDSRRAFEHLASFAASVDEEDVRAQLDVALSGRRGVFGRFRDVIAQYPDMRARFELYILEQKLVDVGEWLKSEGLDFEIAVRLPVAAPAPVQAPAREPDLVDLLVLGGNVELVRGAVRRSLVLSTPQAARAAFKRLARQIVEHCGQSWRKRYVENTSELAIERFRLVHEGSRIDLFVETSPEIYRRFSP